MAATSTMDSCTSGQRSKHSVRQLRKPAVEKLRRDRINSSIKQLRLLLETDFQIHQPNSKLEKADILEMTVNYLKQQHLQMNVESAARKTLFPDYNQGYSQCLEETLQFLSYADKMSPTHQKVLQYFHIAQPADSKAQLAPPGAKYQSAPAIWRPW
ncbi:transcription factor HES-5-like [Pseudophryne corroboree]|uniref:transcription factor HES-5-like n=1 Tax=Pseudophryne corroboree TaxID=495146 RepID=UPI00308212C9